MLRFKIVAVSLLLAATACSSHGASGIPQTAPLPGDGPQTGTQARLSITVPQASAASAARRPAYVSPSSAQLVVAINGGTPARFGLTTQSPGCAVTAGQLSCTFSIPAPPGNDVFLLALEDAGGRVLSKNTVAATLARGAATPLGVTLDAVPAGVRLVPGPDAVIEGNTAPYHIPGLGPTTIDAEPLDADGNVIIGPGAPQITNVSVSAGSAYASVASAGTNDPQAFVLTPAGGVAAGKTVTVSASAQGIALADGTTSAPVTTSTSFLYTPAVAVAYAQTVSIYSVETGNLLQSFRACNGCLGLTVATAALAAPDGTLYVLTKSFLGLSQAGLVNIFPPGATVAARTLGSSNGVRNAMGLALDGNGMLYVANGSGFRQPPANVVEFASGATTPTYTISNAGVPEGIGVDGQGNVYVPEYGHSIEIFAPGNQTAPSRTVTDSTIQQAGGIAVDAAGDFFVADTIGGYLDYVGAGSSSVTKRISGFSNIGGQLLLDPAGDLWVSLGSANFSERLDGGSLPNTVKIIQTIPSSGGIAWIP